MVLNFGLRTALYICFLFFVSLPVVSQEQSEENFQQYYDLIYQVKVVAKKAGGKSSIGSGFQISESGLIVTNYHVVSSYVQFPDKNKITYESHTGEIGQLELVEFDVINDIALLQHPNPSKRFLNLSTVPLNKGDPIFSLGNPSDFGIKLVKGPNNGMADHRYDDLILFSASINGGMSGGPALNQFGDVVGVNVSTAGGQLSFLVPVSKVAALIEEVEVVEQSEFQNEIAKQIKIWQRKRIGELIDSDWPEEPFTDRSLFGQIRSDFQCWGGTNEDDKERRKNTITKRCSTGNSVYLDSDLDTGNIVIWFKALESIDLNIMQFSQAVDLGMYGSNKSNFENSTNYQCHTDFVDQKSRKKDDEYTVVSNCIRRLKKFDGLYDSLMRIDTIKDQKTFTALISIYAVEKDQIQSLNRKFIGEVL